MKCHYFLSLVFLTALSLTSCKPPEGWTTDGSSPSANPVVKLETRDGVAYEEGGDKPFSGEHFEYYSDEAEKVKTATTYVDGLKSGPEVHYRKNGKISREYGYHQGIARYVLVRYDSGLAKMISFYENETDPATEQFIGPHVRFHENGFPGTNGIWAADHKQWNKRFMQWDENGKLLGDYLFDNGDLSDIYFETEQQKADRKERYKWNEKNLKKEQQAAAAGEATTGDQ